MILHSYLKNFILISFFLFSPLNLFAFELDENNYKIYFDKWNRGEFNKYENIFRRDNENAFATCVGASCGGSLLEQYSAITTGLKNIDCAASQKDLFGNSHTYEDYQDCKKLYDNFKKNNDYNFKILNNFFFKNNLSKNTAKKECKFFFNNNEINNFCTKNFDLVFNNQKILGAEIEKFYTLLENFNFKLETQNNLQKNSQVLKNLTENNEILYVEFISNIKSKNQLLAEQIRQKNELEEVNRKIEYLLSANKDLNLFGVNLGENLNSVKKINKQYNKKLISYFGSFIHLYKDAHTFFDPQAKNEIFDDYIISYGPENKKILGIFARTKRKYNSESECIKDLKPVKLYLVEKFEKNGNLTVSYDSSLSFDISTRYKEKSEYIASLILNCNVKDDFDNSRFAKDLQYMFKDVQNASDYFGIKLDIDVDYIKDSRGWIGLINSDYIFQINSQFSSIKEKNENKNLDKEIKSKKMKNL